MSGITILQIFAYTISSVAALIGIYTYISRKINKKKATKQYTPKQKRKYWKRVMKKTKDPGKRKFAANRYKALDKQIKKN